jgi:hypothetical protein
VQIDAYMAYVACQLIPRAEVDYCRCVVISMHIVLHMLL